MPKIAGDPISYSHNLVWIFRSFWQNEKKEVFQVQFTWLLPCALHMSKAGWTLLTRSYTCIKLSLLDLCPLHMTFATHHTRAILTGDQPAMIRWLLRDFFKPVISFWKWKYTYINTKICSGYDIDNFGNANHTFWQKPANWRFLLFSAERFFSRFSVQHPCRLHKAIFVFTTKAKKKKKEFGTCLIPLGLWWIWW